MNEKIKIDLVKKNNQEEIYRKQKTAKEIGNIYSLSKEIGIIGEALEFLFIHYGITPPTTFTEWRTKVNEIKLSIKQEISK